MNKLKRLQKRYADGAITKEQYEAAVADLLDDEDITQDEHDTALEFEPEAVDDKAIYTQSDVDGFVLKKARTLVKKALRDAGVDISDVKPQELLETVANLAAAGKGADNVPNEELKALRKKANAYDELASANENLAVENGVLKLSTKFKAVNPIQVVRALKADYSEFLEYDEETGELDTKSVEKALKRIVAAEPNLFHQETDPEDEDLGKDEELDDEPGFKGKTPGGAGGASQKKAQKAEQQKLTALELMGIKQEK